MIIKRKVPRWYSYENGVAQPMYELPKKKSPGMKAYTVTEARELGLLPSVTSVLSVIDKPELDNSRVSKAIHSALTLPKFDGEGEDAFAERVLVDAEAQSAAAAEFGTQIHDAIAGLSELRKIYHAKGMFKFTVGDDNQVYPVDDPLVPYLKLFAQWADENIEEIHAVEKVVGHPSIGVAGRLDLDCTLKGVGRTIVDFKTQNIKDKPKFWGDWPVQLAAYAMLCEREDLIVRRTCSVIIPSNAPGPVSVQVWPAEQTEWHVFQAALQIWIYKNKYDPRRSVVPTSATQP